jgi:hypothetical protein
MTIALSKSTFAEAVALPAGVTLAGACAELTLIAPAAGTAISAPTGGAIKNLTIQSGGIGLEATSGPIALVGVVIQGGSGAALHVTGQASLSAHGLLLAGGQIGLLVEGSATASIGTAMLSQNQVRGALVRQSAALDLFDAAVEGTTAGNAVVGAALEVSDSASLELSRVVAERAQGAGVISSGMATLSVSDAVLRSIASSSTQAFGRGISASGGRVIARRVWVEGAHEAGIIARGSTAEIDLSDAVVDDTDAREIDRAQGVGIWIDGAARATLSRLSLFRNRSAGVQVTGAGSATISDLVAKFTDVRRSDGQAQAGLSVEGGGIARVQRAVLVQNRGRGVLVGDPGSTLSVSDLSISDSLPDGAGFGQGMYVISQSHADLARVRIERCTHAGIQVVASTSSISDLFVSDIGLDPNDPTFGMGLAMTTAARAQASCVQLQGSTGAGLYVLDLNTVLSIDDLTIRGVLPIGAHQGGLGHGIDVIDGSSLFARRVVVDDTVGASLVTIDGGSGRVNTASISDVVFSRAKAAPCAGTGCPDPTDAIGVEVDPATNVRVSRFSITGAEKAGVSIAPGATALFSLGTISGVPVGVELTPTADMPVASVLDRVSFSGDAIDAELPPPPSIAPP